MEEALTMEKKQEYVQMMHDLTYNLMLIIFVKKNGEERVMLATRNRDIYRMEYGDTYNAMNGMDNKCSIQNGNIACIDMVIGEARMFNRYRVLQSYIIGEPKNNAEYSAMFDRFMTFKEKYTPITKDMDVKAEVTGNTNETVAAGENSSPAGMTPQDIENIFNMGNVVPVGNVNPIAQTNSVSSIDVGLPLSNVTPVAQGMTNGNVYLGNNSGTEAQSAFSSAFELGGSGQ